MRPVRSSARASAASMVSPSPHLGDALAKGLVKSVRHVSQPSLRGCLTRGTQCRGGAARPVAFAVHPSPEAEPELPRQVPFVYIVGRVSRPCERGQFGGQAKVRENLAYGLAFGNDGEDAKPTAALGACHHVDAERSAEQGRPVDALRCRVEHAAEEPIPVAHGNHVRRERDDAEARPVKVEAVLSQSEGVRQRTRAATNPSRAPLLNVRAPLYSARAALSSQKELLATTEAVFLSTEAGRHRTPGAIRPLRARLHPVEARFHRTRAVVPSPKAYGATVQAMLHSM
jgi:hypothetical protein